MTIDILQTLFKRHKETSLYHRYITNAHITPLLSTLGDNFILETIGHSVLNKPIYAVKVGSGEKRILMWSQMHGNESTTTKAIFDVLNTLNDNHKETSHILKTCTLYSIPILNPDGAEAYTRINANAVDLNRDAQALTQAESSILKEAFDRFKPHFCYNLHGQRTIFSAGSTNKPATVSFLAPAQDEACTVTDNRKVAMEVIGVMNTLLQNVIPNQVGVYDDSFNMNCVGDTFQSQNIPTILFEAGHYPNDYPREQTRKFIYLSLMESLDYISNNDITGNRYKTYYNIPENQKCFFDIIIRNAHVYSKNDNSCVDIGILYQETLRDGVVEFLPKVEKIAVLDNFFGHYEISANGNTVKKEDGSELEIGHENVFVMINTKKISLLLK
ncbi:M14 metallopeptidase family protein [Yeosuana marina]|uniref:M14 family metallopeptidase n=1 Tax=Yeosuana marina TaxID=1565536 RepID=UPI0030EBC2E2|tara:strand:- start:563 stop:1720 length:1158 start_codon:yes stop_codon:yes gene_type:complete